jgi:excinuclease ABC subunit B
MYADRITNAMRYAMEETQRRRARQTEYNEEHGITPQTIMKAVLEMDPSTGSGDYIVIPILKKDEASDEAVDVTARIEELRSEMLIAAEELEFGCPPSRSGRQLRSGDMLHPPSPAQSSRQGSRRSGHGQCAGRLNPQRLNPLAMRSSAQNLRDSSSCSGAGVPGDGEGVEKVAVGGFEGAAVQGVTEGG